MKFPKNYPKLSVGNSRITSPMLVNKAMHSVPGLRPPPDAPVGPPLISALGARECCWT